MHCRSSFFRILPTFFRLRSILQKEGVDVKNLLRENHYKKAPCRVFDRVMTLLYKSNLDRRSQGSRDPFKISDFVNGRGSYLLPLIAACAAISKRGKLLFEICHTIPIQISTSKATITTRAEMINP